MKFGLNQINKESPEWFVLLTDIIIIIVMPAFAIWALTIPERFIAADIKNFIGASATFFVAILKGLQIFTGKKDIKEYDNEG